MKLFNASIMKFLVNIVENGSALIYRQSFLFVGSMIILSSSVSVEVKLMFYLYAVSLFVQLMGV